MRRLVLTAFLALALAGCHTGREAQREEQRGAEVRLSSERSAQTQAASERRDSVSGERARSEVWERLMKAESAEVSVEADSLRTPEGAVVWNPRMRLTLREPSREESGRSESSEARRAASAEVKAESALTESRDSLQAAGRAAISEREKGETTAIGKPATNWVYAWGVAIVAAFALAAVGVSRWIKRYG